MTLRLGLATLAFVVLSQAACTCDPLPIDDHQYACASDADCGELSCVNGFCGGTARPDAGPDAGSDAGVDAGFDGGTDGGFDGGTDAGTDGGSDAGPDAGVDAGTDAGVDAGTDAGVDAGVDAGIDAGVDAGFDAGNDAGVDAGIDAGVDAGIDAGVDAGIDAGLDAGASGPCHSDDDCAGTGRRCAEGTGQCVAARSCNTNSECDSASPADYCFTGGKGCRCVVEANDAGSAGVCRRRHGPCEPCAADVECGSDVGFSPQGACFALDGGSEKVCVQQKVLACPCGTTENGAGFCVPTSGTCAVAPCGDDSQCPADLSCNPAPICVCEARCRWNFALGREDAPGCAVGQVCWVDNANLAAGSPLYGFGRCRVPCLGNSDCNLTVANPFGGTGLKCASEVLPDAGASLMRCRGNGICMDDAECALGGASAARGYCNRSTHLCETDCRLATNPVTTQPFDDCNPPNTCQVDAGANVCLP